MAVDRVPTPARRILSLERALLRPEEARRTVAEVAARIDVGGALLERGAPSRGLRAEADPRSDDLAERRAALETLERAPATLLEPPPLRTGEVAIRGRVVFGDQATPMPRARVASGGRRATTDDFGRFVLALEVPDLPAEVELAVDWNGAEVARTVASFGPGERGRVIDLQVRATVAAAEELAAAVVDRQRRRVDEQRRRVADAELRARLVPRSTILRNRAQASRTIRDRLLSVAKERARGSAS